MQDRERRAAWQKEYNQAHKEEISARHKRYYQEKGEQIRARVNTYRQNNPELIKERKKAYYNRPEAQERRRAYHKHYFSRPEVRERRRAYMRTYRRRPYRRSPEAQMRRSAYEYAYRQRPEVRARMRAYYKAHGEAYFSRPDVQERIQAYRSRPEVQEHIRAYRSRPERRMRKNELGRVHGHARRAREKAISGTYTAAQILDLLKRQKYKCYYCRTKFKKLKGMYIYHIEHTYPISRVAGTDIPANDISYLVLACPTCNVHKGDRFPWEFPEGGRLL